MRDEEKVRDSLKSVNYPSLSEYSIFFYLYISSEEEAVGVQMSMPKVRRTYLVAEKSCPQCELNQSR